MVDEPTYVVGELPSCAASDLRTHGCRRRGCGWRSWTCWCRQGGSRMRRCAGRGRLHLRGADPSKTCQRWPTMSINAVPLMPIFSWRCHLVTCNRPCCHLMRVLAATLGAPLLPRRMLTREVKKAARRSLRGHLSSSCLVRIESIRGPRPLLEVRGPGIATSQREP